MEYNKVERSNIENKKEIDVAYNLVNTALKIKPKIEGLKLIGTLDYYLRMYEKEKNKQHNIFIIRTIIKKAHILGYKLYVLKNKITK